MTVSETTENEKMVVVLDSDTYGMTHKRRNYLVLWLSALMSDGGVIYKPSVLTIEHVIPHTIKDDSEWAIWWSAVEEKKE